MRASGSDGGAGAVARAISAGRLREPGETTNQRTAAVAAAVSGMNQRSVRPRCHQRRGAAAISSVRAMAASSAWQRAHPAACNSTTARSPGGRTPSAHAASVSASRHMSGDADVPFACSVRRNR